MQINHLTPRMGATSSSSSSPAHEECAHLLHFQHKHAASEAASPEESDVEESLKFDYKRHASEDDCFSSFSFRTCFYAANFRN